VVSDNSGLVEAVDDGQTGLLVKQNDPGATADSVLELLFDSELLKQLSGQAKIRAVCSQTWDKISSRYLETFYRFVKK